jgi:4'-phosphopantetheinyl transferase
MLLPDPSWPAPEATPVPLPPGEVHIWRVGLHRSEQELARLERTLSPEEQHRAHRFRIESARRQFIASRAALRSILAGYLSVLPEAVRFSHGPMGKPELPLGGPPLHFNLSHSDGLALIAASRHCEVGVDVERVRTFENQLSLAERFFAPAEVRALIALTDGVMAEAFFHAWTRKEAFVKACGQGIGFGVDRVEVSLVPGEPARLLRLDGCEKAAARWSLRHLSPAPGYVGALAVQGEPGPLRAWHWLGT